jgi:hypothetical protein
MNLAQEFLFISVFLPKFIFRVYGEDT